MTKRVPIWTASAPSANAALKPLLSAIPPAAITGMLTASTTCGTSVMVVCAPICPPDSIPSAITALAPPLSMSFASATLATTGITMTPASFHMSMYFAGFPAPVVTTFTFSSAMIFAISSASGFISMRLTPNGLSVSFFAATICSFTHEAGAPPAPMMPSPPALDTALASSWVATHAMPP